MVWRNEVRNEVRIVYDENVCTERTAELLLHLNLNWMTCSCVFSKHFFFFLLLSELYVHVTT